jgi:hypothetical protein
MHWTGKNDLPQKIEIPDNYILTIGRLWHSMNSNNLGFGALTLSQIAIIENAAARAKKQVQFRIFGTLGVENYGPAPGLISVCGAHRNFIAHWKSQLRRQLRECDLVLDFGEGDSFTDIYGLAVVPLQVQRPV